MLIYIYTAGLAEDLSQTNNLRSGLKEKSSCWKSCLSQTEADLGHVQWTSTQKTSLQRGSDNASSQNTMPAQSPSSPKPGPFPSCRMAHISTLREALSVLITSFCCKPKRNYFSFFLKPAVIFPQHCTEKPKMQPLIFCLFQHLRHLVRAHINMMENKNIGSFYQEPMTQLLPYFPSTSAKQELCSWGWPCHFPIQTTK